MKAIKYEKYGPPDVLELKEVDKPIPKDNEILVKIYAASVNPLDWHYLRGTPKLMRLSAGLVRPKNKILGADIAGRVEAVGKMVKQFQAGDDVFGDISQDGLGGFAEYVCVSENSAIVIIPANVKFKEAAAIPVAAVTALQGLRDKGKVQHGQRVLINGASGGVGTFCSKDLMFIRELIESGNVVPVIDKSYPLHESAEAIRYLEKGHARGKVTIII